jgi:hypothetical protein
MSKETGGAAFPRPHKIIDANHEHFKMGTDGLTIRDYFAGQALAGNLASFNGTTCKYPSFEQFAIDAYAQADAMLAERSKI